MKKIFFHRHEGIYYDNLAKSVSELEKTDEFRRLHIKYTSNNDIKK